MILTRTDFQLLDELLHQDSLIVQKLEAGQGLDSAERALWTSFAAGSPHLMLHAGFDEYAVLDGADAASVRRYGIVEHALTFAEESIFRGLSDGVWYVFDGRMRPGPRFDQPSLHFLAPPPAPNRVTTVDEWCRRLKALASEPDAVTRLLWLPGGPTLRRAHERSAELRGLARPILQSLRNEAVNLREVHWRDLEELVAELLASQGLKVDVTKRSRDGGRDIVARGDFGHGESLRIAVEVKQKAVVGIEDVRNALHANQDYPALMIATAGHFSMGVVEEKARSRNLLRLFLKDGVALRQWIAAYAGTTTDTL